MRLLVFTSYAPSDAIASEESRQKVQIYLASDALHMSSEELRNRGSVWPKWITIHIEHWDIGCYYGCCLQFYSHPLLRNPSLIQPDHVRGAKCLSHMVLIIVMDLIQVAMITTPLIVVNWLDNWPIGLKLNKELSRFCSQTFLVIISSWSCR